MHRRLNFHDTTYTCNTFKWQLTNEVVIKSQWTPISPREASPRRLISVYEGLVGAVGIDFVMFLLSPRQEERANNSGLWTPLGRMTHCISWQHFPDISCLTSVCRWDLYVPKKHTQAYTQIHVSGHKHTQALTNTPRGYYDLSVLF